MARFSCLFPRCSSRDAHISKVLQDLDTAHSRQPGEANEDGQLDAGVRLGCRWVERLSKRQIRVLRDGLHRRGLVFVGRTADAYYSWDMVGGRR